MRKKEQKEKQGGTRCVLCPDRGDDYRAYMQKFIEQYAWELYNFFDNKLYFD